MKTTLLAIALTAALLPATGYAQSKSSSKGSKTQATPSVAAPPSRLEREVRHEILTVPQYGVFDSVSYQVNGTEVTLTGSVRLPVTKINIQNGVKSIEGVDKVEDKIEVLPVFPMDDRIRIAVYNSIYGYPPLQRYALQAIPSIHIIVNNGNVKLEGAVLNKADADMALIRAKTVPGTFAVTSNLKTDAQLSLMEMPSEESSSKKK